MKKNTRLLGISFFWLAIIFFACKQDDVVNSPTITTFNCSLATFSATPTSGSSYNATVSIPYVGGNGVAYSAGTPISSTGIIGLTATLQSGTLANGTGSATYTITGTPSGAGTAIFAITLGGQTCSLSLTVSSASAAIGGLTCGSATFSATATSGAAYTGTATVPYTGGNGALYMAATAIASTGVTGLTAMLPAGTLANGAGNLTYAISGTPNAAGTATFALSFGGQSCNLGLAVTTGSNGTGLVTDNNPTLPACTTTGIVAASSTATIVTLRNAMVNFRNSLSTTQLGTVAKCLDNTSTFGITYWHNTPAKGSARGAIRYGELSATQLGLFKTVLQSFMSADGYKKVNEITTLAEGYLNNLNSGMWDPNYYWLDLYGNPSSSGSWGFQLDGHHCAINFLVHGEEVSIVPAFIACEPCTGTFNGTSFDIVKDERELGLTLYNGLSAAENAIAVTAAAPGAMSVGPAGQAGQTDSYKGTYSYAAYATGLKYSSMTATTKTNVISIMKEYVYNMNTAFADKWWTLINDNIDNTYFVWRDQVETPSATTQFYYRIYNPYLWIEYAMENPVGAGLATYNHAHTITRIPYNTNNGGDYGIFAMMMQGGPKTLQEHYDNDPEHQRIKRFYEDMNNPKQRFASFKLKQTQVTTEPVVTKELSTEGEPEAGIQ